MKILIIGGVAGGASTAARLRRMDEQTEIILFERGEYISYANCGLPYYIGGTITNRDDLFVQTAEGFSRRFRIDIRVLNEVIRIDKENKTATVQNLATGKEYTESYDKLVISTGSEPVKPPIKGIDNKNSSYMQTSDKNIYALGDAVEILNPIINKQMLIPLAGPANKQARIVADNILESNKYTYPGTIGTSIAKVFDLTVAATGVSSKVLSREHIQHISSFTHGNSHAGYYPGTSQLSIEINFSPEDGELLGAQVVGKEGADKRIELFAQVIKQGGTIYDLMDIEHAYAPPYSSAKDPVNMAGFVADNILKEKMKIIQWHDIEKIDFSKTILLDVRTIEEWSDGYIKGAVNISLDELRSRIKEIPEGRKIVIYCAVGLRGYIASRILTQHGFSDVANLSGGYKTYMTAIADYRS